MKIFKINISNVLLRLLAVVKTKHTKRKMCSRFQEADIKALCLLQ